MRQKTLFFVLNVVLASVLAASAASAMQGDSCTHDCSGQHTITSLVECVTHAAKMGHIANDGITNSLLKKLSVAKDAIVEGNAKLAINLLDAFINQVEALAEKKIKAECANHQIEHALDVIETLEQR